MKETRKAQTAPPVFELSDFYLAAFLICSGLEFLRAKGGHPARLEFVLKDSPDRTQLIHDYYSHKSLIDPLAFKNVIVNLKSLIHGLRSSGTTSTEARG